MIKAGRPILVSEIIDIPKPYASCHASTIVESHGSLVAAWFAGSSEGKPDVSIWLSRRNGDSWTAPEEVADGVQPGGSRHPCWNPVLFQPDSGPLLLFYKVGPMVAAWWGMVKRSYDGGKTWSKGERLPDEIFGPIKNKPIQTVDGTVLCPSSDERDGWTVHFERYVPTSGDWHSTGPLNDGRSMPAIQPSILVHRDGRLQAVGRTQCKRLFTIFSEDGGDTWGEMTLLDLPNPNSGTDAVTLADGRFLLVYNHSESERTPLNVALSHDGLSWEPRLVLEDTAGEYSYPAVIQTSDGTVHITYTWQREQIKHVALDPRAL